MEQHPVPQNVTTFQFRLIGDMTIKQFGYLAGGALLAYISYKIPLPFVITWPLAIVFLLTGFGFAFVPVEERPMDVWVLSFFKSVYSPTQFVWQKGRAAFEPSQLVKAPPLQPRPVVPGVSPAIPVAPAAAKPSALRPPTAVLQHVASIPMAPPLSRVPSAIVLPRPTAAATPSVVPVRPPPPPISVPRPATQGPSRVPAPVAPAVARIVPRAVARRLTLLELLRRWFSPKQKATVGRVVLAPGTTTVIPASKFPSLALPKSAPLPPSPAPSSGKPSAVAVRTGRRGGVFSWIVDLFAPSRGPVIAPERVYTDVFAGGPAPGSITGKRLSFPGSTGTAPVATQPQHRLVTDAQAKISSLEDRLSQLQKELQTKSMNEARILELQQQLTELLAQRNKMERELLDVRRRLTAQPAPQAAVIRPAGTTARAPIQPTVKVFTAESALRAGLPRLTTFPNVITGIVRDGENNMLPGVLVTVRDKDDVPLRALKTNKLGQFAASTPLSNGTYIMEVEDPRGKYYFDRVQIAINGTVLPAIEIVARSQREIDREKLAKEIFGVQKM